MDLGTLLSRLNANTPLWGVAILSAALMCLSIHDGHEWGGDFALYIEQALAIDSGQVNALYATNKLAMEQSDYAVGPYLYPFGFPLLLWPILKINGIHFIALKAYCGLFLLLSIPVIARLFRRRIPHPVVMYSLFSLTALHVGFVTFTDHILSDLPFFFFALLALASFELRASIHNQLIVGALIFAAWFVRDIGIVLLPALAAFQFSVRTSAAPRSKDLLIQAIPYGMFILLFGIARAFLPDGGANHLLKLRERISLEQTMALLPEYRSLFEDYFFVGSPILFLFIALMVVGMIKRWKEDLHFLVFTLGYLAVILAWPHFQGIRFVFPVLPFLVYFMLQGLWWLTHRITARSAFHSAIPALLAVWILVNSMVQVGQYRGKQSNEAWTPETQDWYQFLSSHVMPNETVGFEKPRVLRLFAGVKTIYTTPATFAASAADLLFVHKYFLPVPGDDFALIRETEHFYLLRRKE